MFRESPLHRGQSANGWVGLKTLFGILAALQAFFETCHLQAQPSYWVLVVVGLGMLMPLCKLLGIHLGEMCVVP